MQWLFDIRYFTSILQYRCISIEPMPHLHAVFKIVTIICIVVQKDNALYYYALREKKRERSYFLLLFNQVFVLYIS